MVLFPVPGWQRLSQTGDMLTRFVRSGVVFPRLLCHPPARFVSQSKPTDAAAASTAVTELHPPGEPAEHAEVSPYVKVSSAPGQQAGVINYF